MKLKGVTGFAKEMLEEQVADIVAEFQTRLEELREDYPERPEIEIISMLHGEEIALLIAKHNLIADALINVMVGENESMN